MDITIRQLFVKRLFAACFLMTCSIQVYCQESSFDFRFINLPENYKNQYIRYVEKDPTGLLWFVTTNGLHWYDGNRVVDFDTSSSPVFKNISITSLFADSKLHLWIVALHSIIRFDLKLWKAEVTPFTKNASVQPIDQNIISSAEGMDGTVYFGSSTGKLYRTGAGGIELVATVRPSDPGNSPYASIMTVQEPVAGQLWLTTNAGQLIRIEHGNGRFQQPEYFEMQGLPNKVISQIYFNRQGKCIFSTDEGGLYTFDVFSTTFKRIEQPATFPAIYKKEIFISGFNHEEATVFINRQPEEGGNYLGMYNFSNDSLKNVFVVYPKELQNLGFIPTFKSRENSVLASTNQGIIEISKIIRPFNSYLSTANSISSIRTIYKRKEGLLYVSSYKDGFLTLDEKQNAKQKISEAFVYTILPWAADTLLLGNEGAGLSWFYEKTGTTQPIIIRRDTLKTEDFQNKYITCLRRENDSLVWVGTYEGFSLLNMRRLSRENVYTDTRFSGQPRSKIFDILAVGNKRFFAMQEGVFVLDIETRQLRKLFEKVRGPFATLRYNSFQYVNGEVWVASQGNGIVVLDTNGALKRTLTTADGLAGNTIYSLSLLQHYVLAGTGQGLSIINVPENNIQNYAGPEYLPADEFNHSAWFINGDTAYLGTMNGLILFDINRLRRYQQTEPLPHILFTGLTVASEHSGIQHNYAVAYNKRTPIVITPDINFFSLYFGSLDPLARRLKFYYRLDQSSGWQEIGQQLQITFAGIAPGNYNIELAAQLPDRKWSVMLLALSLTVEPAFYQTRWFILLLAAALILLVWVFLKYREKQLFKEHHLRTKIAGDLHDEVGSMLTRIYIQANSLTGEQAKGEAGIHKDTLLRIASSSKDAILSMGDMVWSIDSRFDTIADLVYRMKDYVDKIREDFGIECLLEINGKFEGRSLMQLVRQNLFLIFKEGLHNAIKHAGRQPVKVKLDFTDNIALTMENRYKDSLFRMHAYQGGNGLANMKLRAEKMNAGFEIVHDNGIFSIRLVVPY